MLMVVSKLTISASALKSRAIVTMYLFAIPQASKHDEDNGMHMSLAEPVPPGFIACMPDAKLYRILERNPSAAVTLLQNEVTKPATTDEDVHVLEGHLCTFVQFMLDGNTELLISSDFVEAIWHVVLDTQRYRMLHNTIDECPVDPIPVVSVMNFHHDNMTAEFLQINMYWLMYLFQSALRVQADRVEAEGNSSKRLSQAQRRLKEDVLLPRIRELWAIIWDHQGVVLHHPIHDQIFHRNAEQRTSLRTVVITVLFAIESFLNHVKW